MRNTTTVAEFTTLVQKYAQQGGVSHPALNDTDTWRKVIDRGLREFTKETHAFFKIAQTLTVSGSVNLYDVEPIWQLTLVADDNGVFLDYSGKPGSITPQLLQQVASTFATDDEGTPNKWFMTGESQLFVYPTPATSGTLYLTGWATHSSIQSAASGDLLEIPDTIVPVAALFIGVQTKYPFAQGEDVFEQILAMDQFAYNKLLSYRKANKNRYMGKIERIAAIPVLNA